MVPSFTDIHFNSPGRGRRGVACGEVLLEGGHMDTGWATKAVSCEKQQREPPIIGVASGKGVRRKQSSLNRVTVRGAVGGGGGGGG